MSEEKEVKEVEESAESTSEPKKKGKLPLIIIIAILIVVGVFIVLKSGSKGKNEPPPVELGEIEALGAEFIANLADGRSYIRTNISVQLVKTFKAEELKKYLPPVRDAVVLSLASKGMEELNSLDGKENLKREIAYKINEVLDEVVEKKPGEHKVSSDHSKQSKLKPKQPTPAQSNPDNKLQSPTSQEQTPLVPTKTLSESKPWDVPKEKRKNPEWDSDTGPVARVYFTDFATQ